MERVEEVAEGVGRGEAPPQEAAEPAVGLEGHDVIETVAGGGEQQDEGLELLRLGVAAPDSIMALPSTPCAPSRFR